jgi:hypothetical protein
MQMRANAADAFLKWWRAVDRLVGGKGATYGEARPHYDEGVAPFVAAHLIILAREACREC